MSPKSLAAGKEVTAYCGKCKLNLASIIVVMNGERIGKVQCRTCKSIHSFKDPALLKNKKKAKKKTGSRTRKVQVPLNEMWKDAIDKSEDQREKYSPKKKYIIGQIIDHPNFGLGVIEKLIDKNKVEVIFENEIKTLAHNL